MPARLVEVESRHGRALVRALITDRQQRGSIFLPMHWTDQFASLARAMRWLMRPRILYPASPGLKRTPVAMRPYPAQWYGFAVTARRPAKPEAEYWALCPAESGYRLELAGAQPVPDWQAFAAPTVRTT